MGAPTERGPERVGARTQKSGGPKGGGPKKWEPKAWGARTQKKWGPKGGGPEISLFFFSPPAGNFFLSSLSGGFLVEFWWCLKRRDAQMCAFGVLWLSCEAPAVRSGGAAGVPHDNQRTPNVHILSAPTLQTQPKFKREDPQRDTEMNEFSGGREKKKSEILGGPGEGRSGGGPGRHNPFDSD